ncbi:phage tail fiber protein [Serratia fonticola]
MAVISGVLKGPMGDARVGVVIELRAVRTSASVVIQARSQSVTDATGRYTLSVEPGQYDVMITASGRQPERVGAIQVMVNSATGTLNDFLLIPGESDLNPAIVATVDQMRAEAAASAIAAKTSETNASAAMTNALSKVVTTDQSVAGGVNFSKTVTSKGILGVQAVAPETNAIIRFYDTNGAQQGSLYNATTTGQMTLRWGGVAYSTLFNADGTVTFPGNINIGSTAVLKAGDYGVGANGIGLATGSSCFISQSIASGLAPNGAGFQSVYAANRRAQLFIGTDGKVISRFSTTDTPETDTTTWNTHYTTANTTVDANGFIKKASPIVKLFGDGTSELNDESQGVTTERISEGVYRVSGTLGFNSDAEWGGVDGGIEIPIDRNKLPLIWLDYDVEPTGDLLIKTFHRVNSTAPKFAQNVKVGYKEGQPIDIPDGRWIDLRVEMPGGDEPEHVPEPEPEPEKEDEVILEPEQPEVTELEDGEEPVSSEEAKE